MKKKTKHQKVKTNKAGAMITPFRDGFIVSVQYPGSDLIHNKEFDEHDEAVQYANEFLAQFKQS